MNILTRRQVETLILSAKEKSEQIDLGEIGLSGTTYLSGLDLRGANLSTANLEEAILSEARYTSDTVWPDNFDPESAGAVQEEGVVR